MDDTFIRRELESLIRSLYEINTLISCTTADESRNAGLFDARHQILHALGELNIAKVDHSRNINDEANNSLGVNIMDDEMTITMGSLVLAPRYFEKQIIDDFAIVLSISSSFSDNRHQNIDNDNLDTMEIAWLRPQSRYEMATSSSIVFPRGVVEGGSRVIDRLKDQRIALASLRIGDRVLHRLNDKDHIWVVSRIHEMIEEEDGRWAHVASLIHGSSSGRVPVDLSFLAPLPGPPSSSSTTTHSHDDGRYYHSQDDVDEGDGPSFNYAAPRTDFLLDPGALLDELSAFGTWEKHTKGVGSRVLRKMGYQRGRGLGSMEQGALAPVQSAAVLPPGRSLDFIHETTNPIPRREHSTTKTKKIVSESTMFDWMNRSLGASPPVPESPPIRSRPSHIAERIRNTTRKSIF